MSAPKPGFRIRTVHAFTSIDPADDEEGVIAFRTATGDWMPMVAADEHRIDDLRPMAAETARLTGRPVTLKRFDMMTIVETIEP